METVENGFKPTIRRTRRVKTPTVIQIEGVECGAACLAMILGYHGRFVSLDTLRIECGVSRDGSKATNILKAGRKYGLLSKGWRIESKELKDYRFPVIAFWNFNHFVVVDGYGPSKWYLNDPATGPRTVPADEFDSCFTGVVLTLEPGPDFKKGGVKPGFINALKARATGLGTPLTYAVTAGIMLALVGLVIPTFSKIFIDKYLVMGMKSWVKPLLWAMGFAVLLQILLTWLQQNVLLRLEIKLSLSTSSRFFFHVLRLPVEFFAHRFAGEIGSRVELNDQVAQILSGQLATAVLHCFTGIFFILVMLQYDVVLTLVGILIALTNLVALTYVSRKRKDLNKRLLQEQGKMLGVSMGGLLTIETLKATGGEADFFETWSGHQAKAVNSQQDLGVFTQFLTAIPALLTSVNTMAMLGLGGLRVMQGYMTVGDLVAFQALMTGLTAPFNTLVVMGSQLQEADGDLHRLDDVLQNKTDWKIEQSEETEWTHASPAKLSGHVELRNITFGYSPLEEPLIRDFSLTLNPGNRVALVGASGSGKSTVAKMVAGLFDPWQGEILFDGLPRESIPRRVLSNSMAFVDQDILLFEGTVRENLSLWDDTIPEEALVHAAQDASVHDMVASRANGYDNWVEEEGRNFSGGQRQRLEIARALAGNPRILVMDEATSALDPLTEKIIDDNLRRRGCTCLIIAHRLSTIRDCDEIIVLDGGRVAERGIHEHMCRHDGPYMELIREY